MVCKHVKVYAQLVWGGYPAQFPWICARCGEEGSDRVGELPELDLYTLLIREKRQRYQDDFTSGLLDRQQDNA